MRINQIDVLPFDNKMPTQECTYCNRNFTKAEHLRRHVRSHTKEKPFKCGTCGKRYAREDTLIRHAKSHFAGTARRITLLEASTNHGESGIMHNEEQSPEGNTIISTPSDMAFLGNSEYCQTQLQSSVKSMSTPVSPFANFSAEANMSDFNNIDYIDDPPWWTINCGFPMNEVNTAGMSGYLQDIQLQASEYSGHIQVSDSSENTQLPAVLDMRDIWFTTSQRSEEGVRSHPSFLQTTTPTSRPTLSIGEPELINEEYRRGLTKTLIHLFPQEDFLPSSEFLNLCLRRYLKCFNPIFPVIHAGTFQPTPENGFLLISMASVGCLFLGSQAAAQCGRRIFEGLNKAILASWDKVLGRTRGEILAMIQAAIIGQTFAMLSGDARHLAIFDAYHSSLISFARRGKTFEALPILDLPENLSDDELEAAWQTWARKEELTRISMALQIHDAELSALLHHEPLLKYITSEKPMQTTARCFSATTASKWASAVRQDATLHTTRVKSGGQPHLRDSFTAYVKLEGLGVMIAANRRQGCLDQAAFNYHQENLLSWRESYAGSTGEGQPGQLCLLTLWHWTYMSLLVDFDQLESAIGRDGPESARDAITYVSNWALTPNSSRCMLHAFLVQKQLQACRFDDISPIHVPRILFSSAIAWHCYIRYGQGNATLENAVRTFDTTLPEFRVLDSISHGHLSYITRLSWEQGAISSIKAATLCELGGLLQRMTHWGLAGKFANIVTCLIDGEPQGVRADERKQPYDQFPACRQNQSPERVVDEAFRRACSSLLTCTLCNTELCILEKAS